jgi:hypothetical protein
LKKKSDDCFVVSKKYITFVPANAEIAQFVEHDLAPRGTREPDLGKEGCETDKKMRK